MPWFKVDDSFPMHPKVLSIPRRDRAAAVGLWTLAGAWCAQQLTDGRLDTHMVNELGGTSKAAQALVDAGLWDDTDRGYAFHDWEQWQPTKAAVEADRSAARARMRSARLRRSSPDVRANTDRSSEVVTVTPSRPVPTRPLSTSMDPVIHTVRSVPAEAAGA